MHQRKPMRNYTQADPPPNLSSTKYNIMMSNCLNVILSKTIPKTCTCLKTCIEFGVVWERTKQRWSNMVQRNKHGTDAQLQYK